MYIQRESRNREAHDIVDLDYLERGLDIEVLRKSEIYSLEQRVVIRLLTDDTREFGAFVAENFPTK